MKSIKCFLLLMLSGFFLTHTIVFAQKPSLILIYSFNPIKGKFNGEYILTGNGNVFEVPKLTGASGYGIGFGFSEIENGKRIDIAFTYTRTVYDATYGTDDLNKTNCNSFGMEYKGFLRKKTIAGREDTQVKSTNPVFLFFYKLGLESGNLRVKDSYYIESSPSLKSDADLIWITFPLGIGISINPAKAFSLNFEGGYRLGFVASAREVGSKEDALSVKNNLGMGGLRAGVEFLVHF